jgi:hypothetical protein
VLEHFAEELVHAFPGLDEGFATGCRCAVHPAYTPVVLSGAGPQQSLPFHPVQNRVQRAGAQAVSVSAQLVDHFLPKDWTFSSVMEKMQPDEPRVQISICHRNSITDYDNENRGYCSGSLVVKS